jgi:TRAP-type C4-dicarboxylate transport system permease small subunit
MEGAGTMRSFLDRFYSFTLYLAAACLVLIAAMVGAQVLGRIYDGLLKLFGVAPYGFLVASLAEIAGFLLAAASFLALAGTLKRGGHIRVTAGLGFAGPRVRHFLELWVLTVAAAFLAFVCWSLVGFTIDSWRFNEVSYGIIPTPLWIPQSVMAFGACTLLLALADELQLVLRGHRPSYRASEDAAGVNKEG